MSVSLSQLKSEYYALKEDSSLIKSEVELKSRHQKLNKLFAQLTLLEDSLVEKTNVLSSSGSSRRNKSELSESRATKLDIKSLKDSLHTNMKKIEDVLNFYEHSFFSDIIARLKKNQKESNIYIEDLNLFEQEIEKEISQLNEGQDASGLLELISEVKQYHFDLIQNQTASSLKHVESNQIGGPPALPSRRIRRAPMPVPKFASVAENVNSVGSPIAKTTAHVDSSNLPTANTTANLNVTSTLTQPVSLPVTLENNSPEQSPTSLSALNGIEILNRYIQNPTIRNEYIEKTELLYLLISEKNFELASALINEIINDFQKHTHRNNRELKREEKLILKYALRDIIDDVSLQLQASIDSQNKAKLHPSLPAYDVAIEAFSMPVGRILTNEENFMNQLNSFVRSINTDPKFIKLEKELINDQTHPERSKGISDLCDQMNHSHETKRNLMIDPSYASIETHFLNPLNNFLQTSSIQLRNGIANTLIEPFTPKALFQGLSFLDFVKKIVGTQEPLIESVGGLALVETILNRLSYNVGNILDEMNMARLTVKLNDTISHVFTTIGRTSPNATKEDFIQKLGILNEKGRHPKFEQFVTESRQAIINNILNIVLIRRKKGGEDFIAKLGNFGIHAEEKTLEIVLSRIINKFLNNKQLKEFLSEIPDLNKDNPMLVKLGIQDFCDQINANKEVIVLHILKNIFGEIDNIAHEARKKERKELSSDVSRMNELEAVQSIQDSCYGLIDSVTALSTKGDNMHFVDYYLNKFFRMGMSAALKQVVSIQGGGGILDASSSVYYGFFQEWQRWLSSKFVEED